MHMLGLVAKTKTLQVVFLHRCIVFLIDLLQYISYNALLKSLDLKNIRELEDLLISAIYADIIHGRLDQQNSR